MKKIIVFCSIFYSCFAIAQNTSVEKSQFKVVFLTPGLESEIGITSQTTLSLELTAGILYTNSFNNKDLSFYPTLESQYRFYYNLEKRARKGKRVAYNSGNYIALFGRIQTGKALIGKTDFLHDYTFLIGPTWGFQRTYKKGFNLAVDLGVVYGFNDIGGKGILPVANIKLGWVLNKRR